jgi:transcriptional regulator GlxA family with amidase domain
MSSEYAVTMATRRYEQRRRAQTAEETRRRVLEAVYEQLREAPAQPVSVDRIARTAGVARSTCSSAAAFTACSKPSPIPTRA